MPSSLSGARVRSYIFKLPLFTRLMILAIVTTWFVGVVADTRWDVRAWGALVPDEVGISSCEWPSRPSSPYTRTGSSDLWWSVRGDSAYDLRNATPC